MAGAWHAAGRSQQHQPMTGTQTIALPSFVSGSVARMAPFPCAPPRIVNLAGLGLVSLAGQEQPSHWGQLEGTPYPLGAHRIPLGVGADVGAAEAGIWESQHVSAVSYSQDGRASCVAQ